MGKDSGETQTTSSAPWAPQIPYLTRGFEEAGKLMDEGAPEYYPGDLVADRSPYYGEGQQLALDAARNQIPGMMAPLSGAFNFGLSAPDVANNPYVQAMNASMADQAMTNFERFTRPGVGDQADAAGQFGGSRHGIAEGLAFGETNRAVADAISRNNMQAYGQGLGAMQNAMAYAPTMAGMYMQPSMLLQSQAAQDQAYQQREIEAERERHMWNQQAPWDFTQRYMNLIGGQYGGDASRPLGGNRVGSTIGNIGTLAGAGAAIGGPWGAGIGAGLGLLSGFF